MLRSSYKLDRQAAAVSRQAEFFTQAIKQPDLSTCRNCKFGQLPKILHNDAYCKSEDRKRQKLLLQQPFVFSKTQ